MVALETEVLIAPDRPTVVNGERINPTGRKRLARSLERGDLESAEREAKAQAMEGADVIDVNVGVVGMDEEAILSDAVQLVAEISGLPISVDTAKVSALEAALRVCLGKALVNSVNGEERSLQTVFPLAKEYGAPVIGLAMDEAGIPRTPQGRLIIAEKIVTWAAKEGIAAEDVIIDPLALSVGADQQAVLITLETIQLISKELDVNMTVGGRNVWFGLPRREDVSNIFLALAIAAGVTCPIANPRTARRTILITDLLLGRDEFGSRYIAYCRQSGWDHRMSRGKGECNGVDQDIRWPLRWQSR